ncbi:MAG: hypothetical protein KAT65_00850 [Methanophagales archaeon]|nr:hypothetical protein [Methanophagales archaeon]
MNGLNWRETWDNFDALSYIATVGAAGECKNDVLQCGMGLRSGSKIHS